MNIIIIMVYYCLTKFTKNHTTYCSCKWPVFKDENTFHSDGAMKYLMQVMYYLYWGSNHYNPTRNCNCV